MRAKRKIEIFSAGCPVCDGTVDEIRKASCQSCDVDVLNMNEPMVAARAKALGIRSVPAVVIDGKLADCCTGRGVDIKILQAAGLGKSL
ncbi:MAG: thioredoxin family protein [Nitrospirota bacterium]